MLDFVCVQFVQVTQIKLKVPRVWEKCLLRMYVWKTPLVYYLSILIQVTSFSSNYLYLANYFQRNLLFSFICHLSFPERSTRTLFAILLHFQNKPFLDYEHDLKTYDFFQQSTKSLSTCPRINLIDPVSHQSQIWKISGCLPIFTVNKLARPVGQC